MKIRKNEELWFFDQSIFGTYSKLGHGWFKTGIRTPVKIKNFVTRILSLLSS